MSPAEAPNDSKRNTTVGNKPGLILVTGATGYIGGRLVHALEEGGHSIRCMARQPDFLRGRVAPSTEIVPGDVFDLDSLNAVLEGVHSTYYLVHALGSETAFEDKELQAAENFAKAASRAGVQRIIYLSGLGHGENLSAHLRSRQRVGAALGNSDSLTLELRTGIVIGSGSLSFDMIRALVEKLPVMLTPRWTSTLTQPIAVEDVVRYLVEALTIPLEANTILEIGGSNQVSYRELMAEYARQRGLRRIMLPVPVLSPALSSLWLALITPVFARVGRRLVDGLRNETVVTDNRAQKYFSFQPVDHVQAIQRALVNEDREVAETRWSDAVSSSGSTTTYGGMRYKTRIVDSRTVAVNVPAKTAFIPIEQIGGEQGWYYGQVLWRIRGGVDRLLGGVGLRRGRRDAHTPHVGEPLDFWRVESYIPGSQLRMVAEMKLPGRAWLQFDAEPQEYPHTLIRQTAIFDPAGLAGLCYWYLLYPFHVFIFRGMLRGIAARAELLHSKS